MKTKELDTPAATNKWWAAQDAGRYSNECRMRYTGRERVQAEQFLDFLKQAYLGVRDEPTYRKRFVAIKIEQPVVRDRRWRDEVDALATERGYEKVRTAQGITYRIYFAR